MTTPILPIATIEEAQERIRPFVTRTPTVPSRTLSDELETNIYLKLELLQKTGSFKPRGVFNRMLQLTESERRAGVVGFSGGNFAQGLAFGGQTLGIRTKVLMPETTPMNYVEGTHRYGAEVELVADIAAASAAVDRYRTAGWASIHPFDDRMMMAGHGSIGLELLEEVPSLTDVIVSIGGGGLMSGVASAIKARSPHVRVWGVETAGADTMARSLAAGRPIAMEPTSIARTLGAPYVSADTYAVADRHLESVTVVPDAEAVAALRFLLERAKILTEPAASCTLAAARRLRHHFDRSRHLVLVLCGGNISVEDLCHFETEFPQHAQTDGA